MRDTGQSDPGVHPDDADAEPERRRRSNELPTADTDDKGDEDEGDLTDPAAEPGKPI
jgi:hypothetical protein